MGSVVETMKRAIVAGLALALGVCAAAADGRIPIGTVPYTISNPGSYYLTADLTYASAAAAITIQANNVSLDLNGHVLTNSSVTYPAHCVYAPSGYTNIKVCNGALQGGYTALDISGAPAGTVTVEDLAITGFAAAGIQILGSSTSSITGQPEIQVEDNVISTNAGAATNTWGINILYVWGGAIRNNKVVGTGTSLSGGYGIAIAAGTSLTVADNAVTNLWTGIAVEPGTAVKVLRNNSSENGYGIYVSNGVGVEVRENLMIGNTQYGLYFTSPASCLYRDNTAQSNGTNYSIPGSGVTNGNGNY